MKRLSVVAAGVLSGMMAIGCARVEVRRLSDAERSSDATLGTRFMQPWPYLLVTEQSKADKSVERMASVVYLPRTDAEYVVNVVPGWGTVDGSVQLKDGWMLQSVGVKADSKIPESISAISGFVTAASGILKGAGGPDLNPGLYRFEFDENGLIKGLTKVQLDQSPQKADRDENLPVLDEGSTQVAMMSAKSTGTVVPIYEDDRSQPSGLGSGRLNALSKLPEPLLRAEIDRRVAGQKAQEGFEPFTLQDLIRALEISQKAIYGNDDRREVELVADPKARENADSVVAIFSASSVMDNGDGTSTLVTRPFGERYQLCANEPFREQPVGAYCSGFMVGEDLIATAGHCVTPQQYPVGSVKCVFGFKQTNGVFPTRISNADIYTGVRLVKHELTATGLDCAVLQVDRKIVGRKALPIRHSPKIADGAPLYVIGHPCGLPAKYAGNAVVRDNTPITHFVANLDTYGGNSGSAVFNGMTHTVEGILVRGEVDFVTVGNCRVSLVCPNSGCRGEDATRVEWIADVLPK